MKKQLMSALAAAAIGVHALPASAGDAALQGKKVLLVVKQSAKEKAADDELRKLLESRGLVITVADQDEAAPPVNGQDLVLVSSSASAAALGERLRKLSMPVLTLQPGLLGELGMTGPRADADYGEFEKKDHYLYVVNAPHPLAGGLPAGTFVATAKNVHMNWGKPSLAAAVAVTPPGYFDTPVLFGYEKGATMEQGEAAPARRTSFYLPADAFVTGRPTPATLSLLDATLRWSVGAPTALTAPKPNAPGAAGRGRKMLLVVQKVSEHPKPEVRKAVAASNAAMLEHFQALGFEVALADHRDPAALAEGKDLVVISSTVQANVLGGRYKDVKVPIVNFENDILDDMDMSAKRRGVDFGDVDDQRDVKVVNAPHPLAAGLPAGAVPLFKGDVGLGWGVPARGAIVIATVRGAPDKAAIFAYEKGATMDHEAPAPARRVYLPVDYNAWGELTPAGLGLVDRAAAWALGN